jgi:hypothetical protein
VEFPTYLKHLNRLDFGPQGEQGIATILPPRVGKPYANLVSAVDQDGNELAGVRLPDVTVPIATHTGWNLRHPDIGGSGQTLNQVGSTIPFPVTRTEREAADDPRRSIEERYISRDDYLNRVGEAARELTKQRYLLAQDVDMVVEQAARRYDAILERVKELQAADN